MPWDDIADEHLKVVFLALHRTINAADMTAPHANLLERFEGRNFVVFVHIEAATFAIDSEALRQLAGLKPVFKKGAIYAPSPPHDALRAYAETSSLLHGGRKIAV